MTDQQKYYESRQILKERDRVCVNCGETEDIEMHHIVPLSKGGTNNEGNLVWLCTECHYKAHGADIGRYKGKREGRPRVEKPDNAESVIERYLRAEISGAEATKLLGMKRGHSFTSVWFVTEYLKNKGIERVETNQGSKKNHRADVFYKDGKIETYKNGEMLWRR